MCGGALRTYLLDLDALPLEPLIAAVPVSVRSSQGSGGNAVSALLCNLATDDADADRRLAAIASSMRRGKEALSGLSPLSSFAVGGLAMHELLLAQIPGYAALVPPAFNVVISNVPGPTETMYLNGARLDGIYPTSIVMDGQALNITVTNHAGYLDFGLIGDRKRVPHLQRLLAHLENALVALEKGVNLP
jgi:WS/DGAT/MGAT family acyltransferase